MPTPRQTGLPRLPGLPSTHPAAISRRRGGLYGRPDRTPGISGLSVIATRPWRHAALRGGRGQKRSAQATRTRQSAGRCGHAALRRPAGVRREMQAFRADMQSAPTGALATVSCCRGALYMRPGRTAGTGAVGEGAAGNGGLLGRIYNPPLRVRSLPFPAVGAHYICARDALPGPARSAGYGENRSAARAAIKAAPTGAPAGVCRCRSSERERLPLRGAGSQRLTERCCRTEGLPQNFGLCKGR